MNLNEKSEFDAIIIGGGVIGLSIARELRKNSTARVLILDSPKKRLSGKQQYSLFPAAFAAAGMLAATVESNEKNDFFDFSRQSCDLYPDFAADLLQETKINIELNQTGTLYLAFDDDDLAQLETRFQWQTAANLKTEKLSAEQVWQIEPNVSEKVLGALFFPHDWQIENRKLLESLFHATVKKNQKLIESTTVKEIIFENEKAVGVRCLNNFLQSETFYASKIIVAAGAWTSLINLPANFNADIAVSPVRGQMLCFQNAEKVFSHVIYSSRGYVVPRRDNRILVGATVENAGFDVKVTGAGAASLLKTAFQISPRFENLNLMDSWAGLRPKTTDGLPLLGEFPADSNLFWATGHYRNGILLAPLTAKIIADKIINNSHSKFLDVFNPARFL